MINENVKDKLEDVVNYIKNADDEWVRLTRIEVSRMLKLPSGSRLSSIIDALRYDERIASRYENKDELDRNRYRRPLVYRYVKTPAEKYKLSLTENSVTYMSKSDYEWFEPKIKRLFPDKVDQLIAYRILDLLFCQNYDSEWKPFKIAKLSSTLGGIPRNKIRAVFRKFATNGILLASPDQKYRITSRDTAKDRQLSLHHIEQTTTSKSTPESIKDVAALDFGYISNLNEVVSDIKKLQAINVDFSKILGNVVYTLNKLQQTDNLIKTSDTTFARMNSMYQDLNARHEQLLERNEKVKELIEQLDSEPLTGNSMRIFKEIKKVMVTKEKR